MITVPLLSPFCLIWFIKSSTTVKGMATGSLEVAFLVSLITATATFLNIAKYKNKINSNNVCITYYLDMVLQFKQKYSLITNYYLTLISLVHQVVETVSLLEQKQFGSCVLMFLPLPNML